MKNILLAIVIVRFATPLFSQTQNFDFNTRFSTYFIKKVDDNDTYKIIVGGKKSFKILSFDSKTNKYLEEINISNKIIDIKKINKNYLTLMADNGVLNIFYKKKNNDFDKAIIKILKINLNNKKVEIEDLIIEGSHIKMNLSKNINNSVYIFTTDDEKHRVFEFNSDLERSIRETDKKINLSEALIMDDLYFDLSDSDAERKIFLDGNIMYVTEDNFEKDYTLLNRIPLKTLKIETKKIPISNLDGINNKIKFNSFYHKQKIYQLTFSKEQGAFAIIDLKSNKRIFEKKFSNINQIDFSNTPKVLFTNHHPFTLKKKKKEKDELPLMKKLYKYSPDLAINEENDTLKIALGAYYYIVRNLYSPYGNTSSVSTGDYQFGSLFDENGNHLAGEYKLNLKKYVEDFLKEKFIDKYYIYKQDNGYLLVLWTPGAFSDQLKIHFFE